ncbi:tRNA-specific 2-thiouridylase [Hydrogenoanaerobacterium saccharovorans]|uniref:tRNA-specific 2-thiouridylase MnmA n=1 Tax=Hydrogenoanaerobacterium saccharovorans TaxID=474960 RepID=A0A1H8A0R3_9FIRM|nr:tRNA 2-thiouridine(34) synthase MnmA [Hydrogenoanaerobacterium saccharovorans]RPF48290.1 tRNA-specific 2-thiouridylase [Hydrogenoanaerobacterium saccharovorans]SEM63438.1 tRNA-specific 2-thiouridylase [Hydrogenoanaerobacterium saccharovorans]
MHKKVMVAMSGGVDSSAAAALLQEQGYDVCGATLKLYDNPDIGISDRTRTCCSLDDVQDAKSVAYKLGFRHYVFNFGMHFRKDVIERFVQGYVCGETPNPCIDCNRYIKFSKLLQRAILLEKDCIATGHYAQVTYDTNSGRWLLKKARDQSKDQTYVLYMLTQQELGHTLFPLGGMLKSEVRTFAEQRGLVNARKPDSQDICFVKDGDYANFLTNVMGTPAIQGNFIDCRGTVLGKHKGIVHYTIGQRKGLALSFDSPRYVVDKDAVHNTVTLGEQEELFSDKFYVGDLNWIALPELNERMQVMVKTRYHQVETLADISPADDGKVLVRLQTPQRAITPGQAAVFYCGDTVIGGGTILK